MPTYLVTVRTRRIERYLIDADSREEVLEKLDASEFSSPELLAEAPASCDTDPAYTPELRIDLYTEENR